jgi:hypothetical protein
MTNCMLLRPSFQELGTSVLLTHYRYSYSEDHLTAIDLIGLELFLSLFDFLHSPLL